MTHKRERDPARKVRRTYTRATFADTFGAAEIGFLSGEFREENCGGR